MKKLSILLLAVVALCLFSSCSTGRYVNNSTNLNLNQTQVVLSSNNFRVVKMVSALVYYTENNFRFNEEQLRQNAYAQLLRNANLQGSQVLVNVTLENVQRLKYVGTVPLKYQDAVMAQGVVIEFIDPTKEPSATFEATMPEVSSVSTPQVPQLIVQEPQNPTEPSIADAPVPVQKVKLVDKYKKLFDTTSFYKKVLGIVDQNSNGIIDDEEYRKMQEIFKADTTELVIECLNKLHMADREKQVLDVLKAKFTR